jgi:hypothetical protein
VSGKVTQPNETERMFPVGFDVRFDVALLLAGESLPAIVIKKPGPGRQREAVGDGRVQGNGKEAKLARVSAHRRKPLNNQPWMVLVLTEKDHSKLKKSVEDFEASHPQLVAFTTEYSALLSALGI